MNEQNLPKNTKKEVKETAVPVVSNDPQEVNNDSPPKLKEDTGSKGKTNSGSVRKLGCKQQAYAHSFVNLKRKKGISATPLNWLLNAFTLALNDSAPALVCLFTK